jgi:enoyl-CoA hydratase/carnithine racemase
MTEVLRATRDAVLVVTINRPEARNAVNGAVAEGIGTALDDAEADPDVAAVVLTATGDHAFSAGMDLKTFVDGGVRDTYRGNGGFAGLTERRFAKPIVAAVNGAALAGGLELVLACDLVVAAEHATFGLPEVKRGLMAGAGGVIRLPRRIPLTTALEMGLTGEPISADRAFQLGLVNRVVPRSEVVDEAVALAGTVAENAPLAVAATKQLMREVLDLTEDEAWVRNREVGRVPNTSEDAVEGARAFAEKRRPVWKGR